MKKSKWATFTVDYKGKDEMKKTIEVNGKTYEECSSLEFVRLKNILFMETDGERTYYKEKKEFKSWISGHDVIEHSNGILEIGCTVVVVEHIERLLKEYKEFKNV